MKIVGIETFSTQEISIVRVRTDQGLAGYGQTAPYNADISAMVLHRQVAPYALGADADDIEGLVEACVVGEHKFPGSYVCRAVAGLDTALWDLRGKRDGKSVAQLLGSQKSRQPIYGSSMRRDITPAAEGERLNRLQQEKGVGAFKIRIASKFGRDVDVWPGRTETIIPEIRRALDPDTVILADANSGFSPKRAIEVGRTLEDHGFGHFEEPCPYMELEWTAEVADALDIPVAAGEQECDLAQFRRMIRLKGLDVVQPDVCYVGGFSRAREVARLADGARLPCTPHAANRTMVTVFTLHLQAALPNAGPYMEFSIEDAPWLDGLFSTDPFGIEDGQIAIPDQPGWGVEINPAWLERAEHRESLL